ncbi:unnamed protein product [Effrenium voratum]|uniref:EF-hand domain-containing protein n=1 Tax=Effrenium voratum TaxID=2562239 RepID=A0AA36NI86_9DINO|nr:unnamed protein product [Effrenium voratum]CAJ1447904.1 unnamed protein product [Effrenium voratum]
MAPSDQEVEDALEAWGRDETWSEDGPWPSWQGTPTSRLKGSKDSTCPSEAEKDDRRVASMQRSSSHVQLRPTSEQSSRPKSQQSSRPKSQQSSHFASPAGKTMTQRFSADELQCFKRIPEPSSNFHQKTQAYWHSVGELRQNLSKHNWHMLPVLKGQFFQHPKLKHSLAGPTPAEKEKAREKAKRLLAEKKKPDEVEALANEPFVSEVLDRIFPRNPRGFEESPRPRPRRTSMLESYSMRRQSLTPSSLGALGGAPGAARVRESSSSPGRGSRAPRVVTRTAMEEFRVKILEKFTTIKEAFETFMKDLPDRQITKLELSRVLARHGFEWQSKQIRDTIFDRLDFKSIGRVTMVGFYVIVEASAPVRNVEDLRRRWLASRFGSMNQAIMTMVDNSTVALTNRLTLQEFGSRLQLVSVNDPEEHQALFNALCSGGRITVGDLASAISVVSPCLLLEDLRDRLQKRYSGDFKKAFADLDLDRSGSLSEHEFVVKLMDRLHLTEREAAKMFREIDVDGSAEISRNEFISAIGLSEPSLFLEDLRKKVRQRFRSFKAQFADAFDSALNECAAAPRLLLKNFQELLLPLSMSEKETKVLFNLIDIDHDGRLSIREFVRGVRHFAPASVLEDLRVRCCQQHDRITDPFVDLDHNKVLDSLAFAKQMLDIGLCDGKGADPRLAELQPGVPAQALFDILDVANNGEATFGRLLAALQSCGAGTAARLSPMELDMRARNDVKNDLAAMHKLASDVKLQARQGMKFTEDALDGNEWKVGPRIVDAMLEHVDADFDVPVDTEEGSPRPKFQGPPRLKMLLNEDVLRQYQNQRAAKPVVQIKRPIQNAAHGTSDSWSRFWTCVQRSPKKHEHQKLEENLQAYFQTTAMKLSQDGPLVHGTEQRRCPDPFLSKSHLTEHVTS